MGNGGDMGINNEHKEVIVTKRNQFLSKTAYISSRPFVSLLMREDGGLGRNDASGERGSGGGYIVLNPVRSR